VHPTSDCRWPAAHNQRACARAKRYGTYCRKLTDECGFPLASRNGVSADFTVSAHQERVPVQTERKGDGRHAWFHSEKERLREQQQATRQNRLPNAWPHTNSRMKLPSDNNFSGRPLGAVYSLFGSTPRSFSMVNATSS